MAKYLLLFSVDSSALARFIEKPEDRRAPVARLAEAVGGKLIAYYWMFGQYDGMTIVEFPDSAAAAAASLVAASSGTFTRIETHELIEAEDLVKILEKVQTLRPSYRPPGQEAHA